MGFGLSLSQTAFRVPPACQILLKPRYDVKRTQAFAYLCSLWVGGNGSIAELWVLNPDDLPIINGATTLPTRLKTTHPAPVSFHKAIDPGCDCCTANNTVDIITRGCKLFCNHQVLL